MKEADFFARIASRLGRPTPQVPPQRAQVGAPDHWKEQVLQERDILDKFKLELENLGGQVETFSDGEKCVHRLKSLLEELNPSRIGVWGGDFVKEYGLGDILSFFEVVTWGVHGVKEFSHVDVSISGCAYAIADTGTLVMMSSETRGRSVAVLPTVHIVIMQRSQIRWQMGDVLGEIAAMRDQMPSSVHFISGPSRSSDIENDQTIGIHGPARVIAFVVN